MARQDFGGRPRPRSWPALTITALLMVASCNSSDPFSARAPSARENPSGLAGRPSLPEVVASYTALSSELHTALSRQLGNDAWGTRHPSIPTALCQAFGTQADTGIRFLPWLIYDRFVPEPHWREVAKTIGDTARRRGFDRLVHVVDRPDEHRIDLYDEFGAELSVQDGPRLLTIGISTGCHLRGGAGT